jgi:transcriptional regulator with XRE-family HTH domain/GNAT superfamily N-acetyltransferase
MVAGAGRRAQTRGVNDPTARLDVGAALRALRWRADLSQRELARRAGVDPARVARLETGENHDPRLRTVERLVAAMCGRLAVLDLDGAEPATLDSEHQRDRAGRRFPAHLETRPTSTWRGIYRKDWITFWRNRDRRDRRRRDASGQRRWHLFTEYRLLGPRDVAVLALLHTQARQFELGHRPAGPTAAVSATATLDDAQAMRYLRDPAVRHWVADNCGRILGHLVAHLQLRYAGPPALLITDLGLRPEHRGDQTGADLVAAARDEAQRLGVTEIRALPDHPRVAARLQALGFRSTSGRRRLLLG